MRVFVTGASGFIGTGVVPELRAAGHEVVGLARSDASAAAVAALGAEVMRGDLADLDSLRAGSAVADGVVHLAFDHNDFTQFQRAVEIDRLAIEALGEPLRGTGKPLVIASGIMGMPDGRPTTEDDRSAGGPRQAAADELLALAEHGMRPVVVRLARSVHDENPAGFVGRLVEIARETGVSGHIGNGANRWTTVHLADAARLFRLALEDAPVGAVVHGVGEEGVATRAIAEEIGRHLDLPVAPVAPADAAGHFGWLALFLADDTPASSALTRARLGWDPKGPDLLDDLARWFA